MSPDKKAPKRGRGSGASGRPKGATNKKSLIFREMIGDHGLATESLVKVIVNIIQKGELPGRVHPFYTQMQFLNKTIRKRKGDKRRPTEEEWERLMDESERQLVAEQVNTADRLSIIKDCLGYIFPRLKAVEHTIQATGGQQYGVLLIATPEDRDKWSELAQEQQQAAMEEAAAVAKDVT
jgi:hypothetical protein